MNLIQFFNAVTTNGGASYNITTGEYNPANGYFVSLPNNEIQIPLKDFHENHLKRYIRDNNELLSTNYNFLGGWIDNGIVYLDISQQFDDKRFALTLAVNSGQLAIYDANAKECIYLPLPQKSGTYTQQRAYLTYKINELCK